MTSVAFPFLRIHPSSVTTSPWFVVLDGAQESVLGDRLEKWDYISKLQLTRSLSLDVAEAAKNLKIDPAKLRVSVVTTMGTGGSRGERSKKIVSREKISVNSETVNISIEPISAAISQTVKLLTEVVLDAPAGASSRLSPNRPGMKLWSDSKTVHVEPSSAQFPVEASSFKKLFKEDPQGALFHLSLVAPDWDQDFGNSVRLYINSDEVQFCTLFTGGDEVVLRLVMSAIVNQMTRRALSNDTFSLDIKGSLPTSINGVVRSWITQAFPNQSLAAVKAVAEYDPSRFETALASLAAGDAA